MIDALAFYYRLLQQTCNNRFMRILHPFFPLFNMYVIQYAF